MEPSVKSVETSEQPYTGGSSIYQQGVLTLLLVSTYFRVLAREFGYWYYYVSSLKKKKFTWLSLNKKSLDFHWNDAL